jgi:hypothetical protein
LFYWLLLGSCYVLAPQSYFLYALVAVPLPWILDRLAGLRVGAARKTGFLVACRILNILPALPMLGILLFWGPQFLPVFADHNDPNIAEHLHRMIGTEVPVEDTWSAGNKTFVGSGPSFIYMRFPRGSRSLVQNALRANCVPSSGLPSDQSPEAWFMHWDPPEHPIDPYTCSLYGAPELVDFGRSGDTLLFFHPGH